MQAYDVIALITTGAALFKLGPFGALWTGLIMFLALPWTVGWIITTF